MTFSLQFLSKRNWYSMIFFPDPYRTQNNHRKETLLLFSHHTFPWTEDAWWVVTEGLIRKETAAISAGLLNLVYVVGGIFRSLPGMFPVFTLVCDERNPCFVSWQTGVRKSCVNIGSFEFFVYFEKHICEFLSDRQIKCCRTNILPKVLFALCLSIIYILRCN